MLGSRTSFSAGSHVPFRAQMFFSEVALEKQTCVKEEVYDQPPSLQSMTETCQSESCVCGAVPAAFIREEIMNFGVEPFVSAHLGRFDRCSTRR